METQNKNLQSYDIKFSVMHLKQLLFNANDIYEIQPVYNYIKKFFFRYKTDFFFFDSQKYELYKREKAMELIPDDLRKTFKKIVGENIVKIEIILKNYLKMTDFHEKESEPVVDFSKQQIFNKIENVQGVNINYDYVNMGKPLPYFISNKDIEITKSIENDVKLITDHVLNILASGNKEQCEYILNFIACTFGGRKLRKAIYWQSVERTGKGTLLNFINIILGKRMYKTSSTEDILKYTKPFEGCSLLNFDELPIEGQWKSISDVIKGLVTEPTFNCRNMYESGYVQKNTFNIIITTNNNAIIMTQTNMMRWFSSDIDESKVDDKEYFKKLQLAMSKPEVQKAFYQLMIKRFNRDKVKKWNEDEIPETRTKTL